MKKQADMNRAVVKYNGKRTIFSVPDDTDHIAKAWIAGYYYEMPMLKYIEANYNSGVFVDCGSHRGNHSIFFVQYCNASVIAFEPNKINYHNLLSNFEVNNLNNLDARNLAISSKRGLSGLEPFGEENHNTGMYRLTDSKKHLMTKIDTLDSQIGETPVKLIKLDIEGQELNALRGATNILRTSKPALFIECQETKDMLEVDKFLQAYDYKRHPDHWNSTPTYLWT